MEMPQPSAAHRRLERLVGRWRGEERMPPSAWAPEGAEAIGYSDARSALGGFAVVCDYRQEKDGVVTYEGHGVDSYDPAEDLYVMHWFDSIGSPPEVFRGRFEGDRLEMRSRQARSLTEYTGDGSMTTRMETLEDGESWTLALEGSYAREA